MHSIINKRQNTVNKLDAKMKSFTEDQLKLIFNAIRYYQINKVPLTSKAYEDCSSILDQIFPIAKELPVAKPPNPPSTGFGN